jgi:putative CocE/NonD family hydrolase
MTIASRIFARVAKLGPATVPDVAVERDIETKTDDGSVLLGDRWYPAGVAVASAPIILIRTPYGRRQFGIFGRIFAERGFQVLVQSCRGTFDSNSTFVPFRYERDDGIATLRWMADQPWFTGSVATFGPSYLGMTQWAIAAVAPDFLKVMSMQVTASNFRDIVVFPGGSFSLETGAVWMQQMLFQERGLLRFAWTVATGRKRLERAYATMPLLEADRAAFGRHVEYYQEWLGHTEPGDPYWREVDFSGDLERTPPTSHVAGWYDLFLPGQIEDFTRLREAERPSRLTIGPWTHTSRHLALAGVRDALDSFAEHLDVGVASARTSPVRIFVMGRDEWVDLDSWPPPAESQRWYLHGGRRLTPDQPVGSARPDRYLYDPADPTPSVGGASLDAFRAGPKDQRRREQRTDVLTYTSQVLTSGLTVAGTVTADLAVRSSRSYFDVFVRLCDVDEKGRSTNICDGLLRCGPGTSQSDSDGVRRVAVSLWPTANTFLPGHRIRVQVSSAAHPLYARNPGSGEPLGTASHLYPSDHEVFLDAQHPSYVDLPVSSI